MEPNTPHIGQIVDYYPTNSQRLAAIVSEVYPQATQQYGDRPKVQLHILEKDGIEIKDVSPVESDGGDTVDLIDKWGFAHEFSLQQSDEYNEDSAKGSETNRFVGYVGMVA